MKKYLYGTLAGLVAALFLLVGSSGFLAVNAAPTVQAGQLCAKKDAGAVKVASNGKTVRCEKDGALYRWKHYTPPVASSSGSQSASTSASASSSASTSASATSSTSATASSSTSTTPPPNQASSDNLPLTGAPVPLIVLTAVFALGAGGGVLWLARRRHRFTA